MGKGYAAAVLTAADSDTQHRYFAVDIGFSTPLRVTNYDQAITVDGNTYYPWSVDVLEPSVRGEGAHNVTVTMSNLPGVTLPGESEETAAQETESFEGHTLNNNIEVHADWTDQGWTGSPDDEIRTNGYTGQCVRQNSDWSGVYSWEAPGTVDCSSFVYQCKFKPFAALTDLAAGLFFNWTPDGGSSRGDGYWVRVSATDFQVRRTDSGSQTTIKTKAHVSAVNTWNTLKVEYTQSTGTIAVSVWETSAGPGTATTDSVVDTNYDSGKVGLQIYNYQDRMSMDDFRIDYFTSSVTDTYSSQIAALDIAQDSRGKTMKIYECTVTGAAARTDTLVFDGYVDEFAAADDSGTCRFVGVPQENQGSRPGSNYCMSICRWRKFKGDDCQYAGADTTCLRTLTDCRKKVGGATFTGSGLNDMTTGGTFSGSEILNYRVEIDGTETFKWSDSGGDGWDATGVAITGAAQNLNNGVTVTFGGSGSHTIGDRWDFQASWEDYFGNLLHAPAAGTTIEIDTYSLQVPQGGGGYYTIPIVPPPAGGGNTPADPPPLPPPVRD
jgi:hypothetical protein